MLKFPQNKGAVVLGYPQKALRVFLLCGALGGIGGKMGRHAIDGCRSQIVAENMRFGCILRSKKGC